MNHANVEYQQTAYPTEPPAIVRPLESDDLQNVEQTGVVLYEGRVERTTTTAGDYFIIWGVICFTPGDESALDGICSDSTDEPVLTSRHARVGITILDDQGQRTGQDYTVSPADYDDPQGYYPGVFELAIPASGLEEYLNFRVTAVVREPYHNSLCDTYYWEQVGSEQPWRGDIECRPRKDHQRGIVYVPILSSNAVALNTNDSTKPQENESQALHLVFLPIAPQGILDLEITAGFKLGKTARVRGERNKRKRKSKNG